MHTAHHADLKTLMEVARPASVLLLDPNPEGLPAEALPPACQVIRLEGNHLAGHVFQQEAPPGMKLGALSGYGAPATSLPVPCAAGSAPNPTYGESFTVTQLPEPGRFDLGVVANTLEYLDRKTAGILVARLRDIHTRRFVVLAPIGQVWEGQASYWETTDFLGYGMTLLARYQVDGKPLHLYHYAIESYKTTPEWFNSKYWAHPERWKP
ncbi:MAG: DUF6231 family protein [Candidatus Competibacteraceae bacterium]